MRRLLAPLFVLTTCAICVGLAKDPPRSARPTPVAKPGLAQANAASDAEGEIVRARAVSQPAENQPVLKQLAEKPSSVDATSRRLADALVDAYKKADAKAFAAVFTADGEYIDDKGIVFHGRKAIEDEFAAFFRETKGTSIEMELNATRSIAKGVVASDGVTRFRKTSTTQPILGSCHLVCVQEGDTWLIASLHEDDPISKTGSHREQVSKLEWLLGDWIGEGPRSHVHFSCRWDDTGQYLLRDFSLQIAGEKKVSGTQRIGFDPSTGHLKTWIFDSAGGFSDGYFNQNGNSWVLKTSGVSRDGQIASTTVTITPIDKSRMTTETIDRVIGGVRVPDVEKLTIVRKPPESLDRTTQVDPGKN